MSGCLFSGQHQLVGNRGHHLAGGVPPVVVVVLDPRRDPDPCCGPGGELLHRPELELEGGVPGLDHGVVEG